MFCIRCTLVPFTVFSKFFSYSEKLLGYGLPNNVSISHALHSLCGKADRAGHVACSKIAIIRSVENGSNSDSNAVAGWSSGRFSEGDLMLS